MKRMFFAGVVALVATASSASAQCASGNCGTSVIPSAAGHQFGYPAHLGCGGFCFNFLGRMHQHGPLFNYGPYEGYYPFAPYGPWDSNFCYNGGAGGAGSNCGWNPALFNRRGLGGLGGLGHGGLGRGGLGHGGLGHGSCGAGGCGGSGLVGRVGGLLGGFGGGHGNGCGADGCATGAWGDYAVNTGRGVFHRLHPCSNRAKISTGCSFAPPSACSDCAGTVSAPTTSVVQPVSAISTPDPVYGNRVYRER